MIAAGVETRIREAVTTFVSSREGNDLLLRTIAFAHERSVLLLRDELDQLPNVVVTEGEVRLNLVPVIAEVLRSVINAGLDFIGIQRQIPPFDSTEDATDAIDRLATVVGRDLPPDFGQVRIASEESLEQAQGYVRAFDLALWALLIAAIVLGVLAVWLAPSIPVGAVRVGIAAAIAALAGWGLVQVLAARVADAATTADGRVAHHRDRSVAGQRAERQRVRPRGHRDRRGRFRIHRGSPEPAGACHGRASRLSRRRLLRLRPLRRSAHAVAPTAKPAAVDDAAHHLRRADGCRPSEAPD